MFLLIAMTSGFIWQPQQICVFNPNLCIEGSVVEPLKRTLKWHTCYFLNPRVQLLFSISIPRLRSDINFFFKKFQNRDIFTFHINDKEDDRLDMERNWRKSYGHKIKATGWRIIGNEGIHDWRRATHSVRLPSYACSFRLFSCQSAPGWSQCNSDIS